jgi:HEAT repeat protein
MSVFKRKRLQNLSTDKLVERYAEAALLHGENTLSGNYRETNRQHDVIAAIYRELKSRGEEHVMQLKELINDRDDAVRLWAAAHTLDLCQDVSEKVLEEIGRSKGLIPLSARTTLREWRKGTLKFP